MDAQRNYRIYEQSPSGEGSAAGEGSYDRYVGVGKHRGSEVIAAIFTHEQDDVAAHTILFVDHAEPKSGELAIEIDEDVREGAPLRADLATPLGVAAQLARHDHPRHVGSPQVTEKICGRFRNRQLHLAPSSMLPHSSPAVVPK